MRGKGDAPPCGARVEAGGQMSGEDLSASEGSEPANPVSGLDDERLLAAVREMLSTYEPAPDWSVDLTKGSYDLRAVDAELAVLSSDSELSAARSGVRSGVTPRMAVFDTGDLSVEIAIEPEDRVGSWRLVGQLNPATSAHIKICQQQIEPFWVDADRFGRFAADHLQGRPLSLICMRDGMRAAVTEWIAIG